MSWPIFDLAEQNLAYAQQIYKTIGRRNTYTWATTAELSSFIAPYDLQDIQLEVSILDLYDTTGATTDINEMPLYLYINNASLNDTMVVSSVNKIDLTNIDSVQIDFESLGSGTYNTAKIGFGLSNADNSVDAFVKKINGESRSVETIDTTTLSGLYYLKIMPQCSVSDASNGYSVGLRLYGINLGGSIVGPTVANDELTFSESSQIVYSPVYSPTDLGEWDMFSSNLEGVITVDILDNTGNVLVANVQNGDMLGDLIPNSKSGLQLKITGSTGDKIKSIGFIYLG